MKMSFCLKISFLLFPSFSFPYFASVVSRFSSHSLKLRTSCLFWAPKTEKVGLVFLCCDISDSQWSVLSWNSLLLLCGIRVQNTWVCAMRTIKSENSRRIFTSTLCLLAAALSLITFWPYLQLFQMNKECDVQMSQPIHSNENKDDTRSIVSVAPESYHTSASKTVRIWEDLSRSQSFPTSEIKIPTSSKQVDIYKTSHRFIKNNELVTENVTLVFVWRSSTCTDPNREHPAGLLRTLSTGMRPYDVVIDIGACYGDTALPLATYANTVLAFEPNPHSFEVLKTNAEVNSAVNIIPYNLAIGEDGMQKFFYGGDYCNGGEWGQWKEGEEGEKSVDVQSVSLHNFLKSNHPDKIKRIGMIKIDVEGYDSKILLTLKPLLEEIRPDIIVEWFSLYRDQSKPLECTQGSKDLFDAIEEIGYIPYILTRPSQKVKGCENGNWEPDLLLEPKPLRE